MATPKKKPTETAEATKSPTHETVTLTESYANHGSIVCSSGSIDFIDNKATVSSALAEELRQYGIVM